jgi:hypothetical protein
MRLWRRDDRAEAIIHQIHPGSRGSVTAADRALGPVAAAEGVLWMSIHVGEITSEVEATTAEPPAAEATTSVWQEQVRMDAMLERLAADRLRTATGDE